MVVLQVGIAHLVRLTRLGLGSNPWNGNVVTVGVQTAHDRLVVAELDTDQRDASVPLHQLVSHSILNHGFHPLHVRTGLHFHSLGKRLLCKLLLLLGLDSTGDGVRFDRTL